MSAWLYQINQAQWSPNRYRLEIWERDRWAWGVGRMAGKAAPEPGDVVTFFCAPAGGPDPGFYGWAVITEWFSESRELYFTPVAPSDQLKMNPWWDNDAESIANKIRGKVKQGTLWPIPFDLLLEIRKGIVRWLQGS